MVASSNVKVIYLDQKCWIEIARKHYGKSSTLKKELIDDISIASEKGQAIFPLSISHLEETMRISNSQRRERLASLMVKISKCYAFQPYVGQNIKNEILNVVLKKLGLPPLDIRNVVLKRGISHLLGAKPKLEPRKGAKNKLPEKVMKELLDMLETPETFEFALRQRTPRSMDYGRIETVSKMEKNRKELANVKDSDLRKRVFLAKNLGDVVLPELAKILYENGLQPDFVMGEKPSRKDIFGFLDSIPSALCLFTLIYQRDQQFQRPISTHDANDIWFLTLALPYSNIVVADKMFASIARRTHLDKKCGTIVLSSVSELGQYL